jgi:hypothetical protein
LRYLSFTYHLVSSINIDCLLFASLIVKLCILCMYQWWFDGRVISRDDGGKEKEGEKERKGRWWRIDKQRRERERERERIRKHATTFSSLYVRVRYLPSFFSLFFVCCLCLFCSSPPPLSFFYINYCIFFFTYMYDNVSVHSIYFLNIS